MSEQGREGLGTGIWKRTATCGQLTEAAVGERHTLMGWVAGVRDMGALIFVDLRDREGITQLVFREEIDATAFARARRLRGEFVVAAHGEVARRSSINPKLPTGLVELNVTSLLVLNEAEPPPFPVEDEVTASEELRLEYRYVDLRRPRMQRLLRARHDFARAVRTVLEEERFLEVETPYLIRSTPEGSRDYLVPSRLHPGEFYALPQSPQLLKQILMVSGADRYFQFVRCFRDEDLRANRQPEFTQVDLEMSFVTPEDVFAVVERAVRAGFAALGHDLPGPFPRLGFHDAMARFGSDKPDLRFGLEIGDVTDAVGGAGFRAFDEVVAAGGTVRGLAVPGLAARASRKRLDEIGEIGRACGARGVVPIAWTGEGACRSPLAKVLPEERLREVVRRLGGEAGSVAFLVADESSEAALAALGELRLRLAAAERLVDRSRHAPLWVTDFPLLDWDPAERRWQARHHPFTSPRPEDLDLLESDPGRALAQAYDLVIDGDEMGGGSIRMHRPDVQQRLFRVIGMDDEEVERRFGFFVRALRHGAPPHGGIALGLDRLVMTVTGEKSIRDVMAFPKTTSAQCLLTASPSPVSESQLRELHLAVVPPATGSPPGRP